MGCDSDWPSLQPAADICNQFVVPFEVQVISAHRTSSKLPSPDPLFKKSPPRTLRQSSVKLAGGQQDHPGGNLTPGVRIEVAFTREVLCEDGALLPEVSPRLCWGGLTEV